MLNKLQNATRPEKIKDVQRFFAKAKYVISLFSFLDFWFLAFLVYKPFWVFVLLNFCPSESKACSYPWITLTGSGHSLYWLRGIRVGHSWDPHMHLEVIIVSDIETRVSEIGWVCGVVRRRRMNMLRSMFSRMSKSLTLTFLHHITLS